MNKIFIAVWLAFALVSCTRSEDKEPPMDVKLHKTYREFFEAKDFTETLQTMVEECMANVAPKCDKVAHTNTPFSSTQLKLGEGIGYDAAYGVATIQMTLDKAENKNLRNTTIVWSRNGQGVWSCRSGLSKDPKLAELSRSCP